MLAFMFAIINKSMAEKYDCYLRATNTLDK
jgi:hypothetical protein